MAEGGGESASVGAGPPDIIPDIIPVDLGKKSCLHFSLNIHSVEGSLGNAKQRITLSYNLPSPFCPEGSPSQALGT